jgi:hypothetical protein
MAGFEPRGAAKGFKSFDSFGPVIRPKGRSRREGVSREARGGVRTQSILEDYNSRSDYKRWRAGMDLAIGDQATGPRVVAEVSTRLLRDFGSPITRIGYQVAAFPAATPGRTAWYTARRLRGAWLLPQILRPEDITLERSSRDPSLDRIALDVSNTLTAAQLKLWQQLVGEQFENSATPSGSGYRLVEEQQAEMAIAYTLTSVDEGGGILRFDLSRPYRRIRPRIESPALFWSRRTYVRDRPILWNVETPRVLVASDRWDCDCPDYSGRISAVLDEPSAAPPSARNPLPSAQGPVLSEWDALVAGYRARFRELDSRSDRRRACKHIHADRWSSGIPFFEPADYPFFEVGRQFDGQGDRTGGAAGALRFNARRALDLDSVILAVAEASGVLVDSGPLQRIDPEAMPARRQPILWTSREEPARAAARIDDWWLRPGANEVLVWSEARASWIREDETGRALVELPS